MIAGMTGLLGAFLAICVADAFQNGKAAKFWMFVTGMLVCFGIAIFSTEPQPDYLLQECDRYSRFAESC